MLADRKQFGVTLIELMVAVIIVSILLALASKSYSAWIQNQQVRVAAESILNGLQLARMEAVKNNANVRFVLCGLPSSSWEILATSAAAAAAGLAPPATANCISNAGLGDVRVQERSGFEGSRQVTVTATLTDGTVVGAGVPAIVTFNGLGRVLTPNVNGTMPAAKIDVINPLGNRPLSVMQNSGGPVRMCDPSPNLPASDPRHC